MCDTSECYTSHIIDAMYMCDDPKAHLRVLHQLCANRGLCVAHSIYAWKYFQLNKYILALERNLSNAVGGSDVFFCFCDLFVSFLAVCGIFV